MRAPTDAVEPSFRQRVRTPGLWVDIVFRAPRSALILALALVPAVALFLVAALAPSPYAEQVTDPTRVGNLFVRFVSGIITAATIAVSMATLALRRGIKGVGELREHIKDDFDYRQRTRELLGVTALPVGVGAFLGVLLRGISAEAERAREAAGPDARAREVERMRLEELLDGISRSALRAAGAVEAHRRNPHRLLEAALDFEHEYTVHLVRRFADDDAVPHEARERLRRLSELLDLVAVGKSYTKTLDTTWGLSRMSAGIVVSSFAAILVATSMVLGYGEPWPLSLGTTAAAAIVAFALFVVLLPIAVFVSYALRFVFVNQNTLPIGDFVLGPENEPVARTTPTEPERLR